MQLLVVFVCEPLANSHCGLFQERGLGPVVTQTLSWLLSPIGLALVSVWEAGQRERALNLATCQTSSSSSAQNGNHNYFWTVGLHCVQYCHKTLHI